MWPLLSGKVGMQMTARDTCLSELRYDWRRTTRLPFASAVHQADGVAAGFEGEGALPCQEHIEVEEDVPIGVSWPERLMASCRCSGRRHGRLSWLHL